MCSINDYSKENAPMPDDTSSGGGRPMPSTSSKEVLISFGHTIKFIFYWLQCFEVNYDNKIKMIVLFKIIPKLFPPKKRMIIEKY